MHYNHYNHYNLWNYINNPYLWSSDELELYYKLNLDKHPNIGIYRRDWNCFMEYVNLKLIKKYKK